MAFVRELEVPRHIETAGLIGVMGLDRVRRGLDPDELTGKLPAVDEAGFDRAFNDGLRLLRRAGSDQSTHHQLPSLEPVGAWIHIGGINSPDGRSSLTLETIPPSSQRGEVTLLEISGPMNLGNVATVDEASLRLNRKPVNPLSLPLVRSYVRPIITYAQAAFLGR